MTFPTFHEVTATAFATSTQTHNVAYPSTVNANDLLVLLLRFPLSTIGTAAAGWVELNFREDIWYRIATGSESGTFNMQTNAPSQGVAQIRRYSNWLGTAEGIEDGSFVGGAGTTPNPGSATTSWPLQDTTFIAWCNYWDDDETVTAYPSGYGNTANTISGGGVNAGAGVGSSDKQVNATTEDPGSFTITATEDWRAYTMMIRSTPPGAEGQGIPNMTEVVAILENAEDQ